MDLHGSTLKELSQWMAEKGEKPFRATQVYDWIYQKGASGWESMTDLPAELRLELPKHLHINSIQLLRTQNSQDGEVAKYLWQLPDGKKIETVLLLSEEHRTVCVSSQIGCPVRCTFCASGKEGLVRNLTAGEIVEQVYQIDRLLREKGEKVSRVAFMGMGEPLENYQEVIKAVRLLCDKKRMGFPETRITLYTVGIPEAITRLSSEGLRVNLVLSLHAPNQSIREKIIPHARKYPLNKIFSAMLSYAAQAKRNIAYEYALIAGVNDRKEHAEELVALLKSQPCTLNLIPYNPIPGLLIKRPHKEVIERFRSTLLEAGISTTYLHTKGKDITAACGQLALQKD